MPSHALIKVIITMDTRLTFVRCEFQSALWYEYIGCELRRERAKYRCSEPPENGGKSVWVIALCVWAFSMCGQLLYRGRSMAGFWMV